MASEARARTAVNTRRLLQTPHRPAMARWRTRWHTRWHTRLAALLLAWGLAGVAQAAPVGAAPASGCTAELAGPAPSDACIEQVYRGPRSAWPAPQVDPGVRWQELTPRPALPPQPAALVALGEQLFFDRRLSQAQDLSCASCHMPHLGFSDGRRFAIGHQGAVGPRHTPHLFGVAFVPALMWDGRASDLASQALLPIANPIEMALDLGTLLQRLRGSADDTRRFAAAFGDSEPPSLQRLGAALAAFQRTLEAPKTRYDAFIEGQAQALGTAELRGLHVFRTQARCMNCHSGPQLTQHEFHHIGFSFLGRRQQDNGRQAVTGKREDLGAMRTPTLRGLARTAPYFHHGATPNLRGVVEAYNGGMMRSPAAAPGEPEWPQPTPLIRPLKLTPQQQNDLEAFLKVL